MRPLSRDEVRRVDRYAIEKLGIPGVVLMENAGRGAAEAIAELVGGAAGRKAGIVAGAGNNAGDGFVIARHLLRMGAEVSVFLLKDPSQFTGDARTNYDVIRRLGVPLVALDAAGLAVLADRLKGFDVVVDAIGGTGIQGPLRGEFAQAVEQINAAGRLVVAVDIPTGLDCDTGRPMGPTIRAKLTVTFVARKKGFDASGATEYTGQVRVADIGIPAKMVADLTGASDH